MQHASQDRQKKATGTGRLMVWSRQTLHWCCYYWIFSGIKFSADNWENIGFGVFFLFCFFESDCDSCVSMSAGALKCRGWHVYNTSLPNLTWSLQVPQDEWSNFSPLGKDDEIPCRRMRSGSYIKAMAEEDSGDSDCSPKPSPKVQARRASYLKATQPSLTEMTTLKWVCTRAQIITWNYSL